MRLKSIRPQFRSFLCYIRRYPPLRHTIPHPVFNDVGCPCINTHFFKVPEVCKGVENHIVRPHSFLYSLLTRRNSSLNNTTSDLKLTKVSYLCRPSYPTSHLISLPKAFIYCLSILSNSSPKDFILATLSVQPARSWK